MNTKNEILLRRRFCIQESATIKDNTLTFTAEQDGSTVSLIKEGNPASVNLNYSIDEGVTWNAYTVGNIITLTNVGDSVKFRGKNSTFSYSDRHYYYFSMSGLISSSGDVTSLLNNKGGLYTTPSPAWGFYGLFWGCINLTTAPNVPLKSVGHYCCCKMFQNCTSLTTAPVLPATTLAQSCYLSMFSGCTSLTTAPELPATTLADAGQCYSMMFERCTSLVNAPALPATILASNCYQYMFDGCTALTTAPELPAMTMVNNCYSGMFRNCTALTTAPVLPAMKLAGNCYGNMFQGCTNLVTAPELPATTLAQAQYCYQYMFSDCTSLTTAPELLAENLETYCYLSMFYNCSNLNYIKALFTTNISNTTMYTDNWVRGVSATGTFVKNSAATWTTTGVNGVPNGWTVETATE